MTVEITVIYKSTISQADRDLLGFKIASLLTNGLQPKENRCTVIQPARDVGDLAAAEQQWREKDAGSPLPDVSGCELTLVMQSKATGVLDNISNPEFRHGYYTGIRNTRIALQLGRARWDRGMSVLQLCKLSKVPQKVIYAVEAGELDDVRLNDLTRIAGALDIALSVKITSHADFIGGLSGKDMSIPSFTEETKSTPAK